MFALCIFFSTVVTIQAQMEGFIVGGSTTSIHKYPHSAFLSVSCLTEEKIRVFWICGSSILNQKILLTAAHCLHTCISGTRILVNMGSEHRAGGVMRTAGEFLIHEKYDHNTSSYDLALVKLIKPLRFSSRISRVAIMKKPPYNEQANLAGWGQTNEKTKAQGVYLKHVDQRVWSHEECEQFFGVLPKGTICARSNKKEDFAAPGDSGSGLVVRGYIQIGLVSFKKPTAAVNIIIYTDVGYFYDWITHHSHVIYCHSG